MKSLCMQRVKALYLFGVMIFLIGGQSLTAFSLDADESIFQKDEFFMFQDLNDTYFKQQEVGLLLTTEKISHFNIPQDRGEIVNYGDSIQLNLYRKIGTIPKNVSAVTGINGLRSFLKTLISEQDLIFFDKSEYVKTLPLFKNKVTECDIGVKFSEQKIQLSLLEKSGAVIGTLTPGANNKVLFKKGNEILAEIEIIDLKSGRSTKPNYHIVRINKKVSMEHLLLLIGVNDFILDKITSSTMFKKTNVFLFRIGSSIVPGSILEKLIFIKAGY